MRVGVLGGTFDPPHLGHLALAAAARHALNLDRVIFVPAGDPWRKAALPVSPADQRLRMIEAATRGVSWAEVSSLEIERAGPSYMGDTLEALAGAREARWWFILGEDALRDMLHWYEPERIIAAARLAVARRPGNDDEAITEMLPPELRALLPDIESRIDPVPMPLLEVSSTDLRERVRDGRPTEFLLPEGVRKVIDEQGLYQS
jgi:nicotinate-nucleotide adenylyltransferase